MSYRILVVEDEEIIRNVLKKLLQKNGFDVDDAGSIEEAKAFAFGDYQLIISDLRLPGGQGTDLIPLAGETPVLIMTSYSSMRSAVDAMKIGAVDYIPKPFDHKEMLETVKTILGIENETDIALQSTAAERVAEADTDSMVQQPGESADAFFVRFVKEHENDMSETVLAKKLGISRKNLWERRQKLGIPRKK